MEESASAVNPQACPADCIYKRWVFRLLVVAQLLVSCLIFLTLKHPGPRLELWFIVATGGAVWASGLYAIGIRKVRLGPRLADDSQFVRRGPYRWVRHPMYTGLMLAALGFVINDGTLYACQLGISLGVVLRIKAGYEEQELGIRFPEYAEYSRATTRFVPLLW